MDADSLGQRAVIGVTYAMADICEQGNQPSVVCSVFLFFLFFSSSFAEDLKCLTYLHTYLGRSLGYFCSSDKNTDASIRPGRRPVFCWMRTRQLVNLNTHKSSCPPPLPPLSPLSQSMIDFRKDGNNLINFINPTDNSPRPWSYYVICWQG